MRRWAELIVTAVMSAGIAVGLCSLRPAAAQPEWPAEVAARAFRLVDERGRTRALLEHDDQANTRLSLRDMLGRMRIELIVDRDGASLVAVSGPNQRHRVAMFQDQAGTPIMNISDRSGSRWVWRVP